MQLLHLKWPMHQAPLAQLLFLQVLCQLRVVYRNHMSHRYMLANRIDMGNIQRLPQLSLRSFVDVLNLRIDELLLLMREAKRWQARIRETFSYYMFFFIFINYTKWLRYLYLIILRIMSKFKFPYFCSKFHNQSVNPRGFG